MFDYISHINLAVWDWVHGSFSDICCKSSCWLSQGAWLTISSGDAWGLTRGLVRGLINYDKLSATEVSRDHPVQKKLFHQSPAAFFPLSSVWEAVETPKPRKEAFHGTFIKEPSSGIRWHGLMFWFSKSMRSKLEAPCRRQINIQFGLRLCNAIQGNMKLELHGWSPFQKLMSFL